MATIRKRGVRWNVQVRRKDFPPLSKSFLVKADAQAWARKREAEIDRGETPQAEQAANLKTFGDLLRRYKAEVTPLKRGAMFEQSRIEALLKHPLSNMTTQCLRPANFAAYRNERLKVVAAPTVRRELAILQHCFEVARKEWGVSIAPNPIAEIAKPSDGRPRERRVSESEFECLERELRQARNPYVRDVFLFAIATGMRRGEILALVWEHVDLENRTALLLMTKNGEPRTVPLSPPALELLARIRSNDPNAKGQVFPLTANAFRLAWDRMMRRSKIENLRFHDLRHEAISRFFEMGLSVPEVSLISGHKDVRMLFRYTHLKPENVARKLNQMSTP